MNIKTYLDYFQKIAENHQEILHSSAKKRFFRLNNIELNGSMRSSIDFEKTILMVESYELTPKDDHSENHLIEYTGAFSILSRVELDDFEAENEALEKCEKIALECSKRMYKNSLDHGNPGKVFLNLEPSSFSFQKVGPIFNCFFGMRVQFNFSGTYSIDVDPSQWVDL